jgi:hypothetical protein
MIAVSGSHDGKMPVHRQALDIAGYGQPSANCQILRQSPS